MGCRTLHDGIRHGITRGADRDGLPWYAAELDGPAVREERDAAHEFLRRPSAGPARRLQDGEVSGDTAGCAWDRGGDRDALSLLPERADQSVACLLANGLSHRDDGSLIGLLRDEEGQHRSAKIVAPIPEVGAAQREVLLDAELPRLPHRFISSAISG